jgi:chorismate lyase / 3-hydroxybenzoate synthase
MSSPRLKVQLASPREAVGAADSLLAEVHFGSETRRDSDDPRRIRVGLPPLFLGPDRERWFTSGQVTRGWEGDIGFAHSDDLLFAHLLIPDTTDMAAAARSAYARLFAFLRGREHTGLLRIWNYFDRMLEAAIDPALDRYQAFCAGRHEALEAARIEASGLPAATAIGTDVPGLLIYVLAARGPGIQVENPRQVSAYHYPREYGPRSPTFSRATLKFWPSGYQLFVSGTASIVGHASLHEGNVPAQTEEVLDNLDTLLETVREQMALEHPPGLDLVKVYVRNPGDRDVVHQLVRSRLGADQQMLVLHGEICRRELLVEIEGLHA